MTNISQCSKVIVPDRIENVYLIDPVGKIDIRLLAAFQAEKEYPVPVVRKKKKRNIDAKKQVVETGLEEDGRFKLVMVNETGKAGLKPIEVVSSIFKLTTEEAARARVVKVESRPLDSR
jgi:hypothetical protein